MNNIEDIIQPIYSTKKNIFFNKRFIFLYACILFMLLGLLTRIAYLQIINPERLMHESNMRSLRTQLVPSARGMISDRNGQPLAISLLVHAIWTDPKVLIKHGGITTDQRWMLLSKVLSISLEELNARINHHPKRRFIYLARQVHPTISEYVLKLKLPGIYLRPEWRRYYPTGQVNAHLIGITNIDNQGIEGIEKTFNNWLTGKPGIRKIRKDLFGHVVEDISLVNGLTANNLELSIDRKLQAITYRELKKAVLGHKAKSGTVILVDINTGEILAMANIPSYNPNNLTNITLDAIRNRAITDVFEPGSTVKPMVIMTALQHGVIKENSILNTLPYKINGYQIRDVKNYDQLSVTGILQKSSNVGISKLALLMPATVLADTYVKFGFGQATNTGLLGEHLGLFPHHRQRWSDIEKAT